MKSFKNEESNQQQESSEYQAPIVKQIGQSASDFAV